MLQNNLLMAAATSASGGGGSTVSVGKSALFNSQCLAGYIEVDLVLYNIFGLLVAVECR